MKRPHQRPHRSPDKQRPTGPQVQEQPPKPSPVSLDLEGESIWDQNYTQKVDSLATQSLGIPGMVLMETAGRAVAQAVEDIGIEDSPVIILVGPGNNGGDALVAARTLIDHGVEVHLFLAPPHPTKTSSSSDARQSQQKIHQALGTRLQEYSKGYLAPFAHREPIIVDGVLGIGAKAHLERQSPLWNFLEEVSKIQDTTVVAIDVPSGLVADSGDHQEIPLKADLTVTFGGKKPAHVLAPARDLCGDVLCVDIGFPKKAVEKALEELPPRFVLPGPQSLVAQDPWANLPRSAHKYDRGHVLLIGGSVGKTGAPLLAALAAMRAGAGWVTVAMPDSAQKDLSGQVPREVTFERLFEGESLVATKLATFIEERKVKSLVIGPGMTHSPLTSEVLETLVPLSEKLNLQIILDAGACHGLADLLADYDVHPSQWVATPHPGEWTKLGPAFAQTPLGPAGFEEAQKLAEDLGCALLFKNATPLLLPGDTKIPGFISQEGTVALARAGSGDLLAGIIGAHGARGLSAPSATLRSLVVLAWAGRLAAKKHGLHAVLARDILDQIGRIDQLLDDEDEDEDKR